ncbi:MAG: restriction endonuclease [Bacteroidetes bacterium]|nr:MAG: restriction endonuclease [Bacteroidota bacterium]
MAVLTQNTSKNKYGQYFTPEIVADFMVSLVSAGKEAHILEPSCGEGVFLRVLEARGFQHITGYEIDQDLAQGFENVVYASFVSASLPTCYDVVIGNPPYIRWSNLEQELKDELQQNTLWNTYFNSLCDYLYIFILKSIEVLKESGELIFICPEYWLNTTHSLILRNYMVTNGYFEAIYHFNEAPIFDKVASSTIIFKYIKSKGEKPTIQLKKYLSNKKITNDILSKLAQNELFDEAEYIEIPAFEKNSRWILADAQTQEHLSAIEIKCHKIDNFSLFSAKQGYHTVGDFCDIGNGMVSGLDKAFQISMDNLNEKEVENTIRVIKAKHLQSYSHQDITPYIFVPDGLSKEYFRINFPYFHQHLQAFRQDLEKRYQYNRAIQYWEWVFLRNFALFSQPTARIFVPCKERISHKQYFRFALVEAGIYPTQDVTAIFRKPHTKEHLYYILAYLNNKRVFNWLKYNGIVKGNIVEFSEKPLASIPFRAIDWQNEQETAWHDEIVTLVESYLLFPQENYLQAIHHIFDLLFAV